MSPGSYDAEALAELGWRDHFDRQLDEDDRALRRPARVMSVHRGKIAVRGGDGTERFVSPYIAGAAPEDDHPTVGDWVMIDAAGDAVTRVLARINLFARRSPEDPLRQQMIAANIDTVFLVASCNQDFNVARLERYLVLARDIGVHPVVVLTKVDLTDDPNAYVAAVRAIQPGLAVAIVDGRVGDQVAPLAQWCGPGRTVALMGSSGVGKSTLVNTLRGSDDLMTQGVRTRDSTGQHTTTVRSMHRLAHGGWLLDTPGMRELQLPDAAVGLAEVFDDFVAAAETCRFSDCAHDREPGCAVRAGIAAGDLTTDRFDRWRKLLAEEHAIATRTARRRSR